MTLADLIAGIAGQLGNTWRLEYKANQPVITGRTGWLTFGHSPDASGLLRVTLLTYDYGIRELDVQPGCGIGETTLRIDQKLLVPAREERYDEAARQRWHHEWCMRLAAWAVKIDMHVEFTGDVVDTKLLALRAEFYSKLRTHAWGCITVFYDGHPAKVEYFTTERAIRERIDAVADRVEPNRRGLFRRRQAA